MNILQCLMDEPGFALEEFFEGRKVPDDPDDSVCDYDYLMSSDDDSASDYPEHCCICSEVICGDAYKIIGGNSDIYLHKSCAELPGEIQQHPLHSRHPLKFFVKALEPEVKLYMCDGCRHFSPTLKYRCKKCKFNLDFHCVSNHESQRQALKERVQKFTAYHSHVLQLLCFSKFPPKLQMKTLGSIINSCCGCQKRIRDWAYACLRCEFLIHESCLDAAPKKIRNLSIHQHPLRFARSSKSDYDRTCQLCEIKIDHIGFTCRRAYSFHLACAQHTAICYLFIFDSFMYDSSDDDHPIYGHYIDLSHKQTSECGLCEKSCNGGFFRFLKTEYNAHVECLLPTTKNHESHDHPLILTDAVEPMCNPYQYHCDICEKIGNLKHHVYHCKECYYIAHIECVLSEEDYDGPQIGKKKRRLLKIYRVEEILEADQYHQYQSATESDYESIDEVSIISESESSRDTDTDGDTENRGSSKQASIEKLETKIDLVKDAIARYTFRLTQLEKKLAEKKSSHES